MKIKRFAALLIGMAMAVSMAACGDSEQSENAKSDSETVSEASQSKAEFIDEPPIEIDYETDGAAKVTVEGTELVVGGNPLWINGVNTPWDNWNDFGSDSFNYAFWEMHFQDLADAGVNATRIWINCSDMIGVTLDDSGKFQSVSAKHWQDLDVLFTIAKKHKIYIMATLLSFDHFKDSNNAYENWRAMITSSENIDSFVDGYVIPFAQRYDSCDYLWSIDFMNEPDWVYENAECGQIGWENISNYFARAAAGVHENSDILVTAGFGIVKYNSDNYEGNYGSDSYLQSLSGNENSYLDFYSTHYYYWQNPWFQYPFSMSPLEFGLDGTKPCVIGEVSANDVPESGEEAIVKYENAYNNGWNGVMAWTSNGVDDCGSMVDIMPATERILEIAEDEVYPIGK